MTEFYDSLLCAFSRLTKKPFLTVDEELLNGVKQCMKDAYDKSSSESLLTSNRILPELTIENFDLEQIWQQIELKNDFFITQIPNFNKTSMLENKYIFKNIKDNFEELQKNVSNKEQVEEELIDKDEDSISEQPKAEETNSERSKLTKDLLNGEETTDDEEGMMMEDQLSEDEEQLELMEQDQFGEEFPQKKGEFKEDDEEGTDEEELKMLEDESWQMEGESADDDTDASDNEKLELLEKEALSEKPWQMKGEVSQNDRPEFSLLENVLEVDISKKPPVVVTEEANLKLEDIIKRRIKDKAFDSVERKVKVVETPLEYKKKLIMNQEKSKQSLAEIYEKEYINQGQSEDNVEEEPESHKEIRNMMTNLFSKLDALSNYHFTPRSAHPGIKVVSNLPVVTIEEVVPAAASKTTLLAPEEISSAKPNIKGASEKTSMDKKRERRKKKMAQKRKFAKIKTKTATENKKS